MYLYKVRPLGHHSSMQFDAPLFFTALGLAFVLEGLPWALFPQGMRRVMQSLTLGPAEMLRRMGLAAVGIGMLVVWLARA